MLTHPIKKQSISYHYLNIKLFKHFQYPGTRFLLKILSAFLCYVRGYPTMPARNTNNWYTSETWVIDPFVLETEFPFTIFPSKDRDHTDLRRIKPNSRNLLIGEQPNPSEILHPEEWLSRHRGAKPRTQCVLSSGISLLSLA